MFFSVVNKYDHFFFHKMKKGPKLKKVNDFWLDHFLPFLYFNQMVLYPSKFT